jgi:hypothetical protein
MSLFQCRKCGCGEDTALCHYWSARLWEREPLCSACDPTVGKWHGEFPREAFELRHKREIERWLELSWVDGDFGRKSSVPHDHTGGGALSSSGPTHDVPPS